MFATIRPAVTKPDLTVNIGSLSLKNPVLVASGTFGYGKEFEPFEDISEIGGIMVKGLTLHAREGNPPPRLAETPCGLLNSIGLQNVGVDGFIREKLPYLRQIDTRVIVNVTGDTAKEYGEIVSRLDGVDGVHAIELNLSCPNIKQGGMYLGTDPVQLAEVVKESRGHTRLPLMVKLSPNVTDIVALARVCHEEGADGVSLINTLLGMAVDLKRRAPVLSRVMGGLSGPAIKPVALRMVWQVYNAVPIPVIGMGGIMTAEDALEFFLVGAKAVAVGTANLVQPDAAVRVLRGVEEYFEKHAINRIDEFVGSLRIPKVE
jgi:dihydroorotate dehydrogenase (NAD+) catalytic subunit